MRFTNGIIIFFVIATVGVDEVLSTLFNHTPKNISCWENNCQLRCNDCSILRAGVANNFLCFQYATISVFECSDSFHRVEMTKEFFLKIEKAEVIKITKTDARRIKKDTFPSSTTLRELYLPENNISIIDDWAFGNMSALTHLYLNNNKLTFFDAFKIIDGLSIKYLNLGNNSLIFDKLRLDNEVYNFKSITYLNLDGNKLRNISMGDYITVIKHRELVKEVSMANNLLTSITLGNFDPLTNLEILNLAFNNISDIDLAFYKMQKLTTLILSHNCISEFDNFAFPSPGSLQYLAIDYNQLILMPNIMAHIGSLKKIAIDGNPWHCNCLKQYQELFMKNNFS
ncbi:leucine-rich repeat-containing protein 70-like, partial [Diabrotica virgifera virgifera]|uniref:Uncharacterized protein n=1 Tax=Diabrotica virgifera virgifera TaxID=50390 RepID=A0ABM5KAM2_DIAVI